MDEKKYSNLAFASRENFTDKEIEIRLRLMGIDFPLQAI